MIDSSQLTRRLRTAERIVILKALLTVELPCVKLLAILAKVTSDLSAFLLAI
jgi:hypothetical protein